MVALALTGLLSSCSTLDHAANATEHFFPVLEVSGSYYDIGHQVGVTFKERIQKASEQYTNIFEFVDKDKDGNLKACKKITERYFPEIMEELRGMAAGAGMQFDRLFAMNMSAEVLVLISLSKQKENPGCSDIHLITEDNKYLLHNEDAAAVTEENMYVAKVTTPYGEEMSPIMKAHGSRKLSLAKCRNFGRGSGSEYVAPAAPGPVDQSVTGVGAGLDRLATMAGRARGIDGQAAFR
jgi:hypothetical protein